ncbi:carbohydrate ABC transporter permease [Marinivivus vitaminiproducens]|uniref:carbohydrate ABC transporter permease n=1 Tax=Marinivivus vitaminiproducens TaxID=3035935 RepID=UPI00279C3B27|nr:sugar ABC transporter permease [Geminicoccaceae bacterium SCSIO 64248]
MAQQIARPSLGHPRVLDRARARPAVESYSPTRSDPWTALWFLLPSLLGLILFLVVPLVASLVLSFTNWQIIGQARFVGFSNYVNLTTRDPIFWQVVANTVLFTVEYLLLNIGIALGLAVWISRLSWGKRFFRLAFFLPTFMPMVGIALVWQLMLTPRGLVDGVIALTGLGLPNVLAESTLALQALVLLTLWSHVGYNLMLFGAALESIPESYLDAAAIDGASGWQNFWLIKLPMISPSLFFGTVLTAITTLQAFDQVYALTRGGPGSSTATLGYAIYNQGFVTYKMGYASALAWILFALIMLLTIMQLRLQRRWVHYDQ